jgi:hypothetical protein
VTIYCAGITTYAYRIGRLWYCARCLPRWYGYSEVLWVKKHRGTMAGLRRRVREYAARLNDPPSCACGCGVVMEVGEFASRWSGRPPMYAGPQCVQRAKWRRKKERRGSVA